jgi:MFS family permease
MLQRALNRLSFAGLAATLVGNGIGRFSFIALMPALIEAGWFTKGEASQLSVATLLGYVVGAWCSDWLAHRYSPSALIRWCMLLISISFFASAFSAWPIAWYYFWRILAGACGAVLMVLPAPLVVPRHDPTIRGRASGIVFSGVGLGAVVSGILVPALVAGFGVAVVLGDKVIPFVFRGVEGAWLGLGAACMALTIASWRQWPTESALPVDVSSPTPDEAAGPAADAGGRTVWLIRVAHGLNAIGYLAHTMFWVDFLVREMGMTLATGGFYWSVFGLGAAVGPMLTGRFADSFGTKRCLLAGFALKAVAAALPVWTSSAPALFFSSLLMGICTPGVLALVSAYTLEVVGPAQNRRVWGQATFSFSLAQGVGGFLMAMAAIYLDSYRPLFVVSAVALLGSIVCIASIRKATSVDSPGEVESLEGPVEPATLPDVSGEAVLAK